jgi:hypothetical protein
VDTAKRLGEGLGIFYRVDLFIHGTSGEILLGEFTPWPHAGQYHCKAEPDQASAAGYDACGMGREWLVPLEVGVPEDAEVQFFEGGKGAEKPAWVDNFMNMTAKERCEAIML